MENKTDTIRVLIFSAPFGSGPDAAAARIRDGIFEQYQNRNQKVEVVIKNAMEFAPTFWAKLMTKSFSKVQTAFPRLSAQLFNRNLDNKEMADSPADKLLFKNMMIDLPTLQKFALSGAFKDEEGRPMAPNVIYSTWPGATEALLYLQKRGARLSFYEILSSVTAAIKGGPVSESDPQFKMIPIAHVQAQPVKEERYLLNFPHAKRNVLIFTDATWDQKSGVVTVMKIMQQKVKEMAGMNVVFITPEEFNLHMNTHVQDIRVAYPRRHEILKFIQQYNPVAIHIMVEGSVGFRVKRLLDQMGVPYTSAFHTDFPKYIGAMMPMDRLNRAVTRLGYKVLRSFHQNSQAILAPTPTMGQILKANGFTESRIASWSHGVEINRFKPEYRDETVFQKALDEGLASGRVSSSTKQVQRPISLFVGRIENEKNLEDFLMMKTPGTKILIGDGKERLPFQEKYPEAIFLGKMPYENLPAYYASADLFVFTSFTDTFGLVLLEAAAAGTPVLAYNVQGPVDVIGESPMGILAPFTPGDNANNIRGLEERFEQALKLDRKAVRTEAEKYPWENSIGEFLYYLQPLTPGHLQRLGVTPDDPKLFDWFSDFGKHSEPEPKPTEQNL